MVLNMAPSIGVHINNVTWLCSYSFVYLCCPCDGHLKPSAYCVVYGKSFMQHKYCTTNSYCLCCIVSTVVKEFQHFAEKFIDHRYIGWFVSNQRKIICKNEPSCKLMLFADFAQLITAVFEMAQKQFYPVLISSTTFDFSIESVL